MSIEIGPGAVLTKLLKKNRAGCTGVETGPARAVRALLSAREERHIA